MRNVIFVVCFLLISGCSTSSGHNFSVKQANMVENGMSREDVISIMGSKPSSITDQGKEFAWSYIRINGFTGSHENRVVRFIFNEDGLSYGIPEGGVYGDISKYQIK